MSRAIKTALVATVAVFAFLPNAANAAPPGSPCQTSGVQCLIYRVNCIVQNAGGNLGPCVWPE